jgi:hypothetical protein
MLPGGVDASIIDCALILDRIADRTEQGIELLATRIAKTAEPPWREHLETGATMCASPRHG